MFEKTFVAGWGDMDFNAHMRNTSFLDRPADVRMMFFAEQQFSTDEFMRLKIGLVVVPPAPLLDSLRVLQYTDDFVGLPSSIRK